jgi:invasion protein IalB
MSKANVLACLSVFLTLALASLASAQAPTPRQPPAAPGAAPQRPPADGASAQSPGRPTPGPTTPVGPEPQATTATYGDWLLRCQRVVAPAPTHQVCDVTQTVQAQGQQGPILQLTFGPPAPKEPMKLAIVAPVNVSFPSAARVAVDEKDPQPAELVWRRCVPGGCLAELEIKDELLKRWRVQAGGGIVQIVDATGREIAIPFSFRGFAQALDALLKS